MLLGKFLFEHKTEKVILYIDEDIWFSGFGSQIYIVLGEKLLKGLRLKNWERQKHGQHQFIIGYL